MPNLGHKHALCTRPFVAPRGSEMHLLLGKDEAERGALGHPVGIGVWMEGQLSLRFELIRLLAAREVLPELARPLEYATNRHLDAREG